MEQKALARWLKGILIGVGICGLIVYFLLIPGYGGTLRSMYPEFAGRYWPWLLFIWGSSIPCFIAVGLCWKIVSNIGNDRSFSMENAKLLKWIAQLALGDTCYFFVGNLVLLVCNQSHPGVVLFSTLIVFVGVAIAVAAAALSHLVKKAADLQEQSDLTI